MIEMTGASYRAEQTKRQLAQRREKAAK